MMIASFVFRLLESTRDFHFNYTEYLLRFIPIFDFSFGFLMMTYSLFNKLIFNLDEIPDAWSFYGSIKEAIALVLCFLGYFALIFAVENWNGFGTLFFCMKKKEEP